MTNVERLSDIDKTEEPGDDTTVYLKNDLLNEINDLNKSNDKVPKQSKVYKIGDSLFEETDLPNVEGYVEFELYKEIIDDNTMDNKDCSVSDTFLSEVGDIKSDAPLKVTTQIVPHGVIINSNVFLTDYQWNTMTFIDINMTKCAVCGVYCDLPNSMGHIQSYNHKTNLDKYKPLEKFDLSITRKINKHYHCGVCNEIFNTSAMSDHETNKTHEGNLLFCINKVTDIMYDFNIHTINNKNDWYHFDAIAINNNENSSVNSYCYDDEDDDDDVTVSDVTETHFEGPSYASMASKPKLDIPKYLKIDLGAREARVKFDYWHMVIKTGLNKFYCMICQIHDHIRYKTLHCVSCEHVKKLTRCTVVEGFGDHLVRMVTDKLYHCACCNNLQYKHEMLVHLERAHPKKNKNLTDDTKPCNNNTPTKNKKNKTDKCNENKINENRTPNRQMSAPGNHQSTEIKSTCDEGKEIDIFGDLVFSPFGIKQTISHLSYNFVSKRDGEYYCYLCAVICSTNLLEHIHSLTHIQVFQMTPFIRPFSCNLIRAVRGSLHCALCNISVTASDIYEHNMKPSHTTLVAKSLGMVPNIQTATKDALNNAQTNTSSAQASSNSSQASTSSVQASHTSTQVSGNMAHATITTHSKVFIRNVSQINTISGNASCSIVQTDPSLTPDRAEGCLNYPQEVPTRAQHCIPAPLIKPAKTGSNISVPQIKPTAPESKIPVSQVNTPGTQNNVHKPVAMPKQKPMKHQNKNPISKLKLTGQQNTFIKSEPRALIGAQINSPLLHHAMPMRPRPQMPPFGSQNTNKLRPQIFTPPNCSPTRSQNYPTKPIKDPFSSQRNTPSPQSSQIPTDTVNDNEQVTAQIESEAKDDATLTQMEDTIEIDSELDESNELPYDTEEYVYVKLRNIYTRITFSSYNSLVSFGDTWRHCFVCSVNIERHELRKHVESRAHLENIKKYNFLEKYEKHLLRQIFLMYHCSVCNVLVRRGDVKDHLSWPTHVTQINIKQTISKRIRKKEIKNGVKQIVAETQKEIIFLKEKEQISKVHINAIIVKQNTQIKKYKIIIFNNNVIKVKQDNWNGITRGKTGGKCIVCQIELDENEVDEHLTTGAHKDNVWKEFDLQFQLALIRKVNSTILNCVICNKELLCRDNYIAEHINSKNHIKNYDAMLKESTLSSTYTDCDEDVLTLKS